ncbi:hypothetical protein ADUPG1_013745 [Aduncisulcus paluster]|uniref:Uncharacterized protein n=1 Tax=Aduncisulcus paluster TaxID=2918883 RepID=A0ABQ5K406_9EUKA|nr:hypothetical protein ADUPG1_013745 [Aduncisulcus paluster]
MSEPKSEYLKTKQELNEFIMKTKCAELELLDPKLHSSVYFQGIPIQSFLKSHFYNALPHIKAIFDTLPVNESSQEIFTACFECLAFFTKHNDEYKGKEVYLDEESFWSHLCYNKEYAVKIFQQINDLLDGWFHATKGKKHSNSSLWSLLISMMSTVPSLVPHLSPKYDDYMRCHLSDWSIFQRIISTVMKTSSHEAMVILFKKSYPLIKAIIPSRMTSGEIRANREIIMVCYEFLALFVKHKSFPLLIEVEESLVTESLMSLLPMMIRVESVLRDDHSINSITKSLFWVISLAEYRIKVLQTTLIPLISPVIIRVIHGVIIDILKQCNDEKSTSKLYYDYKESILSVFLSLNSDSLIREHEEEFIFCCQCLRLFVRHECANAEGWIDLLSADFGDLIETFIGHVSKVDEVLGEGFIDEYSDIFAQYSQILDFDKRDKFLLNVIPALKRLLEKGSKKRLRGHTSQDLLITLCNFSYSPSSSVKFSLLALIESHFKDWLSFYQDNEHIRGHTSQDLLITLCNFSYSPSSSVKFSLLALIESHFKDWLSFYQDNEHIRYWLTVFNNITWSTEAKSPIKEVCLEAWPLFYDVLDLLKKYVEEEQESGQTLEEILGFFANLCCVETHIIDVYENVKDYLDVCLGYIKQPYSENECMNLFRLMSLFYSIPAIIPHLSPKFDLLIEWYRKNIDVKDGSTDGIQFMKAKQGIAKWEDLIQRIKSTHNQQLVSNLYHSSRKFLIELFSNAKSKSLIIENKEEILLGFKCLVLLVEHWNQKVDITISLPTLDICDVGSVFLSDLSRIAQVIGREVDKMAKDTSFLPKISSTFQSILERGTEEKCVVSQHVTASLLATLTNIANSSALSNRSSLLILIEPYVKDWLDICKGTIHVGQWMNILSKITWANETCSPNEFLCTRSWGLFPCVIDFVRKEFVGENIHVNTHEYVFLFLANLCCNRLHAIEIYDNIKDLLDGWFETLKIQKHPWGIKYWAELISRLSSVPSLVPLLSPKYDANMKWCKENNAWESSSLLFFESCFPFSDHWDTLEEDIKKCSSPSETKDLFHKFRNSFHGLFESLRSTQEIQKYQDIIISCYECLSLFLSHPTPNGLISLPMLEQDDLIDTFIGHLSRIVEIFIDIHQSKCSSDLSVIHKYCGICLSYSNGNPSKHKSFYHKISNTLKCLLSLGATHEFIGSVPLDILFILRNLSTSHSPSIKSSILSLIFPYVKNWLTMYNNSVCDGQWMLILANITVMSDFDSSPNILVCSEAWPLFDTFICLIREKYVKCIVEDAHENVLRFFTNLCCDSKHICEVFENTKDLIGDWFIDIKARKHK